MRHPALAPAVLVGVGLAGTLDEVVFHQLLRWHYLVVGAGSAVGRSIDGLFHATMTGLLAVGLVWLARRWRVARPSPRLLAGAVLAGAGGFNTYDGVVDHKVLRLHPVRVGVENTLVYDAAWVGGSLLVLAAGLLLLRAAPDRRGAADRG